MYQNQACNTMVMVPPAGFSFNPETASTNAFQHEITTKNIQQNAIDEFYRMVSILRENGLRIMILNQPHTLPDAVFPNNWFSTHVDPNGKRSLVLYPMLTSNRKLEVNEYELVQLLLQIGIEFDEVIDLRVDASGV